MLSNFNTLLKNAAICNKCKNGELELYENALKRNGLSQTLYTKCMNCSHTVYMETSTRKELQPYDVNIKSAHAAVQGMGYAGLKKVCTSLDLPEPVSKKPFNNICKTLAAAALDKALSSMTHAAERLFVLIEEENPDKIITLQDGRKVANVAVSVDGTWQKRGHTICRQTKTICRQTQSICRQTQNTQNTHQHTQNCFY